LHETLLFIFSPGRFYDRRIPLQLQELAPPTANRALQRVGRHPRYIDSMLIRPVRERERILRALLDSGTYSSVYNLEAKPIMKVQEKRYYRSAELAREAGVSTDTLRHYERHKMLPGIRRSGNNYREYPPESLQRVRLIQRALSIGFTIRELSQILRESDNGKAPCQKVYDLALEKLYALERQMQELQLLKRDLSMLVTEWKEKTQNRLPGAKVHLLTSLIPSTNTKNSREWKPAVRKRRSR
jgi:DNA-binding transcriptional MerR regulator